MCTVRHVQRCSTPSPQRFPSGNIDFNEFLQIMTVKMVNHTHTLMSMHTHIHIPVRNYTHGSEE